MSLVEIARYQDVLEADLAAAFLAAQGLEVEVTERFQTTVDPLMQRALGLRLMARADQAETARDLLARVACGEFSAPADDLPEGDTATRATGRGLALILAASGAFWGTSLPRRLRPIHWAGMALIAAIAAISATLAIAAMAGSAA